MDMDMDENEISPGRRGRSTSSTARRRHSHSPPSRCTCSFSPVLRNQARATNELARTVAERLWIGPAVHLLCGLSTALNTIKSDIGKEKIGVMRVVMRSVLFHGLVEVG